MAEVRDREGEFRLGDQPIAIVGLSGIFPQAPDLRTYWSNILNAVDCTSEVPADRWRIEDYYDPDPGAEDKTYCRRGGFIPDVEFDPLEFGLPPNSLEVTDVAQLLSLMVAKEALRDAGYAEADAALRERTAVVLGIGGGQKLLTPLTSRLQYPVWQRVLRAAGLTEPETAVLVEKIKLAYVPWVEASFPGMLGNVIAGRVANRLDLGGTNCVVDAACASSFAALKMAVGELVEHRADLVISGGVDTDNTILMYMCFSKTPAFSRREQVRPFDADATGTMIGEGLGMYVLKRLAEAERDRDRIYAVIRGIGSSSDGRSTSIYAPLSSGQAVALRRAYQDAGCDPDSVGLVEAHGTGTAAGDSCELTTLHEVFASAPPHRVGLGSVKSQIGHAKSAAGAAGLIKVALALHHKVLPPTINVDVPAERLRDPGSPFYLSTVARPWLSPGAPRRGGVSSFGFGGTNYHVVLEEYGGDHDGPYRLQRLPEAVVVWADTPSALADRCRELAGRLAGPEPDAALAELVALPPPPPAAPRVGTVVTDAASAAERLTRAAELIGAEPDAQDWHREDLAIGYRRAALEPTGRVAALFPGQGSQYVGMGGATTAAFPELRAALELADEVALAAGGSPISEVIHPPPVPDADPRAGADRLRQTQHAQPAIGAVSRGLWTLLVRAGFGADMLAGHSFGELTALWAAGAVGERDIAALADARGRAMAAPPPGADPGGMLAALAGEDEVRRLLAATGTGVRVANINAPRQVVLAGAHAELATVRDALVSAGIGVTDLPVAAAFHTPLVAHAREPFAAAAAEVGFTAPAMPVYANATAAPYPAEPEAVRDQLVDQILNPVLFAQTVENLYTAGARCFVEVGPGGTLAGLVRQTLAGRPALVVSVNPDQRSCPVRQLQVAAMRLRVAGLALRPLDRYATLPPQAKARGPATVRINGANHVSARTTEKFEAALADGFTIQRHRDATEVRAPMNPTPAAPDSTDPVPAPPVPPPVAVAQAAPATAAEPAPFAAQRESERAHEHYLHHQLEAARMITDLARTAADGVAPEGRTTLARAMEMLHEQQLAVSRNHGTHLGQRQQFLRALLGSADGTVPGPVVRTDPPVLEPPVAPVAERAATPPAPKEEPATALVEPLIPVAEPAASVAEPGSGPAGGEAGATLLEIVADKTGYPVDMLDLDMDIEADLGIDSIKRVEILGALSTRYPELPPFRQEEVGELRRLGQIVDRMDQLLGLPAAAGTPASAPAGNGAAPVGNGAAAIESLTADGARLRTLPRPDTLLVPPPEGHVCVLTSDGSPLADSLARALRAWGWSHVVVLPLFDATQGAPVPADGRDEAISDALVGVEREHGPIGGFVHLHPATPPGPHELFGEHEQTLLRQVFVAARSLDAGLARYHGPGRPVFATVARLDGGFGLAGDRDFSAAAGGLFGLVKTLALEWPGVFCRAVDLHPEVPAERAAELVIAELRDPDRTVAEVALTADRRVQLVAADEGSTEPAPAVRG
ncbi:type I polyketide synthase [Actinoallomurus iriomotensis]|uniref:type I polyketide synthase n=1 Tax=Actinoallomurus iriomotensis TaxID=478107 RepID=UPI002557253E|nr:type I polyketide synthase [Actinoallomurus iriomotensis]